jgi:hypothetical protein
MATEQTPSAEFTIAGQPTVSGYTVQNADYGYDEDSEQKKDANGRFLCKITYSRRATLKLEMEANSGTTPAYQNGGTITSGTIADGAGNATAWKIRDAKVTKNRGVWAVSLDLIGLTDLLA